jgi:O-antigen/teichoic acid export membrane protein
LLANALFALALIPRLPADVLPGAFGDALRELQALLQFADLGFAGLALATSLAALANAFFLSVVANGRYGRLLTAVDVGEFAKISAASAGMGAAVWAVQTGLGVPVGKLPGLAMLAFLVAAGAAVYVLLLALLSSSELRTLVGLLRRR